MVSRMWATVLCLSLLASTTWAAKRHAQSGQFGEGPQGMEAASAVSQGTEAETGLSGGLAERQGAQGNAGASDEGGSPAAQELTQEEESALAYRSENPGPEVCGGALSNLHLTYAVIALGAVVLVLLVK